MLCLMRKLGQSIIINGNISVTILKINENQVELGVDAPKNITINREEIEEAILNGIKKPDVNGNKIESPKNFKTNFKKPLKPTNLKRRPNVRQTRNA